MDMRECHCDNYSMLDHVKCMQNKIVKVYLCESSLYRSVLNYYSGRNINETYVAVGQDMINLKVTGNYTNINRHLIRKLNPSSKFLNSKSVLFSISLNNKV